MIDTQAKRKAKSIISKAEKVNSAADFVGKDKITFIVPLIGKEFSIGSSKIGFIEQFEDIKNVINDKLNSISLIEEYSSETDLVIEEMWANVSPKYAYN